MAIKKSELYSKLWKSCDELRGGMDASQYKDYILVLLFMKYVTDKYYGKDDALIEVPEGGGFKDLINLKGDKEIGDKTNKVIRKLADANDLVGVITTSDFNDSDKLGKGKEMVDRLTNLIAIFEDDSLNFGGNSAEGDDLMGDAYEYLMKNFATQSGKSKGQFYTPAEVSRIMAKIIGINSETRQDQTLYDQNITSQENIDKWFEAKTKGLTDYAVAKLKEKWGTMQKVLSSKSRLEKIANDIMLDMATKDRLQNGRGNALLIAGSIYEACKYYEIFQSNGFKKCAIITSYSLNIKNIKGETTGEDSNTENIEKYEIYNKMLNGKSVEDFENKVKKQFVEEPAQMKLLIVVDKLLTGFDAPPATYLYIDKNMQDHSLFQAICRVNRLDGSDKEYGYIIDYMDLFKSLEKSVKDYTTEAFGEYDKDDVEGLLKDRLKQSKERLDVAFESIKALCEPVKPPKDTLDYIHYFVAKNTLDKEAIKKNEQKRLELYKLVEIQSRMGLGETKSKKER